MSAMGFCAGCAQFGSAQDVRNGLLRRMCAVRFCAGCAQWASAQDGHNSCFDLIKIPLIRTHEFGPSSCVHWCPGSVVAWGCLIPVSQGAHFSALVTDLRKAVAATPHRRLCAALSSFCALGNRLCRLYQEPPLPLNYYMFRIVEDEPTWPLWRIEHISSFPSDLIYMCNRA
ncbi:unnamed protein product [Pleuronectes platessa]|uniref:Uncharacterized protein n=1 Tax=Pleuronectes platessa TaxID=8262 RepID=A0A9N7UEF5_PLEPL|nr:unnamed protein product [Pleuronectes platessa]